MATIDIYGSDNVTLTFDYVGLNAEMLTEQEPMTDCPGFHHQSHLIHEWGAYIVRIEGDGEAKLMITSDQ